MNEAQKRLASAAAVARALSLPEFIMRIRIDQILGSHNSESYLTSSFSYLIWSNTMLYHLLPRFHVPVVYLGIRFLRSRVSSSNIAAMRAVRGRGTSSSPFVP